MQHLLYLTADSADCRRFFSSTEIIMNWTWIIQKFLYQKQLIQQIPLGFAAFVMKWRKNTFSYPQIPQICTDSLRMIRTKSDRGGRFRDRNHTSDRSDMTNEFVNVWPFGRRPMVRNTISSSVQFHSSHPSVHFVRVVLVVFKTKISVRICVIRGQIILLDFELDFE